MKDYPRLIQDYADFHTKKITKLTHFIGVPLIFIAIQILLSWLNFSLFGHPISIAWMVCLSLSIYYFFLDFHLAWITTIFLFLFTYLGQLIATEHFNLWSLGAFFILFVAGWGAQLLGHHYEGNKPAFLKNILHLLIAPLFLTNEIKSLWNK